MEIAVAYDRPATLAADSQGAADVQYQCHVTGGSDFRLHAVREQPITVALPCRICTGFHTRNGGNPTERCSAVSN